MWGVGCGGTPTVGAVIAEGGLKRGQEGRSTKMCCMDEQSVSRRRSNILPLTIP